MPRIEIETEADSYRLRCPNGHQVTPTNNHWYCRQCAHAWDDDIDPEYDEVLDKKTGRMVSRDDVDLDFETPGIYYA
jgi:hypothetical protein